jgi:hypothetical protein
MQQMRGLQQFCFSLPLQTFNIIHQIIAAGGGGKRKLSFTSYMYFGIELSLSTTLK